MEQEPINEQLNEQQKDQGDSPAKVSQIRPLHKAELLPWTAPVVLFCGVALLLVVYLGQFASLIRAQYKVVALKDKQRALERERTDLQLQIQHLTSLERVENVAIGQLKMTSPSHRLVLQMDEPAISHTKKL